MTPSTRLLSFSLAGPEPQRLVHGLAALGWVPPRLPLIVSVDSERQASIGPGWFASAWAKKRGDLLAFWDNEELLSVHDNNVVSGAQHLAFHPESIALALAQLPFEVASFGSLYDDWEVASSGFADNHVSFGWAVAFRGEGHRRLPGRRWLDAGPWRILRAAGDVTLVQFHQLDVSAEAAATQAGPGHDLMDAGFVRGGHRFETNLRGLYDERTRTLAIAVHGRELSDVELQDAVAARALQPLAEGPLDNVAYVFVEPEPAASHLPRLWLRDLEVRLIDQGQERRIDEGFVPPAIDKPDWVRTAASSSSAKP